MQKTIQTDVAIANAVMKYIVLPRVKHLQTKRHMLIGIVEETLATILRQLADIGVSPEIEEGIYQLVLKQQTLAEYMGVSREALWKVLQTYEHSKWLVKQERQGRKHYLYTKDLTELTLPEVG